MTCLFQLFPAPSNIPSSLLILLIVGSIPPITQSIARVSVTLHSFSNPDNKLLDGSYCTNDQSPCLIKLWVNFEDPFRKTFTTNQERASAINFPVGDDAIETYTGRISNPFPANSTITNAIRLITFTILAFDYSAPDGNKRNVAKFVLSDFAKFGPETYIFTSGHSHFNLTTNITCETNYYKDCTVYCAETLTSTCNDSDGTKVCKLGWSGPDCDIEYAIPCKPNTSAPHSSFSPVKESFDEDDKITVTCDQGYQPASTNLTCLKNGSWDIHWPYCLQIRCPKLAIPHGEVTPETVTRASSPIGTVANFTCLPGHTRNGTSILSCQNDGSWNGTAPVCNVNLCPDIKGPPEGYGYYSANPPARNPGNVFNQNCGNSYVGRGPEKRLCRNNGTWSGSPLTCHHKCSKFSDEVKRTAIYSSDTPSEDSTAVFACEEGTSLVGDRAALCLPDGTWNITNAPTCVPRCSLDQSVWENMTVSPSTYKTDALEVGYTLTFSCPGPYLSYLSASPFISCLDTGHWNSTVPSCIPVVQDLEKIMNRLLVSGLSVLSGVFAAFIMIVFILIYVNKKVLKTSPQTLDQESDSSRFRRSMKSNRISVSQIEIEHSQISPRLRRHYDDGCQMFNSNFKKIVNNRNSTSVIGISNQAYVEDF